MTRIRITVPGWAHGRTGTARPAFSRGVYHVQLDGERHGDNGQPRDYAFEADEFEVLP